jgi:phytanoyl-CoA hydroxylase
MPTTRAAQRRFFDDNGYLVVPDILSPTQLAELRGMIDRVLQGTLKPDAPNLQGSLDDFTIQWEPAIREDPAIAREQKIRIVFHLCHTHAFFWRHATRPEVLDVVENLLGTGVNLYTDQMFVKPARHGSDVPFHQDSGYWPSVEGGILSCWMAIDDATVENGCVHVVPGTHKALVPHHEFDHPTQPLGLLESEIDVSKEIPVELKAGSAMFHHSYLIHRSFPNRSDRGRRGLVTIYMPSDLRFVRPWPFKFGFHPVRGPRPVSGS